MRVVPLRLIVGPSAATTHQHVVQVNRAANVSSRAQLMASAVRAR